MRHVTYLLLCAATLWLAACAGSIPKPTSQHSAWTRSHYGTEKDVYKGYKLYVASCSGCHSLYHPSSYTDSAWAVLFPEMKEKAKLSAEDADLVLAYITSSAALAKAH